MEDLVRCLDKLRREELGDAAEMRSVRVPGKSRLGWIQSHRGDKARWKEFR